MARVPVHGRDTAPPGSREALDRQIRRVGRVLNAIGGMATAPSAIGIYDAVVEVLELKSGLDRRTRAALHVAIAEVHGCAYCSAAYGAAARRHGLSGTEIAAIRRFDVEDPRIGTLLRLAREVVDRHGHVDDDTWAAAIEAGWSVEDLLDAFGDVIRVTISSWFNHLARTEPDLPLAPDLEP